MSDLSIPSEATMALPGKDRVYGLDVSKFQGNINWGQVPQMYRFVIVRAKGSEGGRDPDFAKNFLGAAGSGRAVGAYAFMRMDQDPEEFAQDFYEYVSPHWTKLNLRPVLDVEAPHASQRESLDFHQRMTISQRQTWLFKCLTHLDQLFGCETMIYTRRGYWEKYVATDAPFYTDRSLWVARYSQVPGQVDFNAALPWDRFDIHQWSSAQRISGIDGNVDANVLAADVALEDLIGLARDRSEGPMELWLEDNGFVRVSGATKGFPYRRPNDPHKVLGHTTETRTGTALALAKRHKYGPHFWVDPVTREKYQVVDMAKASSALRNPNRSLVDTNGSPVIQIEIIGYAKDTHTWPDEHYEWLAKEVFEPICYVWGVDPNVYLRTYGAFEGIVLATEKSPIRLSPSAFYKFGGILWHQHAPLNTHWDGGKFLMDRLLYYINGGKSPVSTTHLKLGDNGAAVKTWQEKLTKFAGQGPTLAPHGADGAFGPKTLQATTNFQRFFGLNPHGRVDDETKEMMEYVISQKEESTKPKPDDPKPEPTPDPGVDLTPLFAQLEDRLDEMETRIINEIQRVDTETVNTLVARLTPHD